MNIKHGPDISRISEINGRVHYILGGSKPPIKFKCARWFTQTSPKRKITYTGIEILLKTLAQIPIRQAGIVIEGDHRTRYVSVRYYCPNSAKNILANIHVF